MNKETVRLGLDTFSYHVTLATLDPRSGAFWFLDKVIELGLDGCQFDPMHLDGWNDKLVCDIASFCRDHNLYLELGSGGFEYDYLLKRLELAADAGARCLRTFISWERTEVGEERIHEIMDFAIPHLTRLGAHAEALGIPIAIENHEDLTSIELKDLLDRIGNPYVRACLDTGNTLSVGENPVEGVRRLAPYAAACHIKDWNVCNIDGKLERTSAPFGQGKGQIVEVLDILQRSQPELPLTIEQPTLNPLLPVTPSMEEDNITSSLQFIRSL